MNQPRRKPTYAPPIPKNQTFLLVLGTVLLVIAFTTLLQRRLTDTSSELGSNPERLKQWQRRESESRRAEYGRFY